MDKETKKMLGEFGEIKHFTSTIVRKRDIWWLRQNKISLPQFMKKYVEEEIKKAGFEKR